MESLPLKDIHLPDPIGWWPPAMGWWLSLLIVGVVSFLAIYGYKRLTRKTAVKVAQKLLTEIRRQPVDAGRTLSELSALLRRTAVTSGKREQIAGLTEQAWLNYLDRSLPDSPFSQGVGRFLADSHYRPSPPKDEIDFDALFALCERWLKQQDRKS